MKRLNLNLVIQIAILIVSSVFFSLSKIPADEDSLKVLAWIINIHYAVTIFLIYRQSKTLFDYNIIFLTILFLYSHGQTLLYSLGVDTSNYLLFKYSSMEELTDSLTYYYFVQILMSIGMLIMIKPTEKTTNALTAEQRLMKKKTIKGCGLALFALSIIPYIYYIIKSVQNSISYGYVSLYNENAIKLPGIILFATYFFIPSLLLLAYSAKNKKRATIIISVVFAIISIVWFIAGYRGRAIVTLIVLMCYINDFYKAIKGKMLLKVLAIGIITIILIPTLYDFRLKTGKNIDDFTESLSETITKKNPIEETFKELGGTNYTYILTKRLIPSRYNYKMGESYLASVLMLIPSPLMGGYTFANKANLDTWLMKEHNMSYGPGFSIQAETYYNFGNFFGLLFSCVLGLFYAYIFNRWKKETDKETKGLSKIMSLIFLQCTMLAARSSFHNTVRYLVFIYIGIFVLIELLFRRKLKKGLLQPNKFSEKNSNTIDK